MVNKSTSPLMILPDFPRSPLSYEKERDGLVRRGSREPPYWCQDDPDVTHLSTLIDLETDSSSHPMDDSLLIESEDLYEPVYQKVPYLSPQNVTYEGLARSIPVCIVKRQSDISSGINVNSSMESNEFTVTHEHHELHNGGHCKEESTTKWMPVAKNSEFPISLAPFTKYDVSEEENNNVKRRSSFQLDRNATKQRNKTPPPVMLRRNRDIVNGFQSPLSPCAVGYRTRRLFSVDGQHNMDYINGSRLHLNTYDSPNNFGKRLSFLSDSGMTTDLTGSIDIPVITKVIPPVQAFNVTGIENNVGEPQRTTDKIYKHTVAVEGESGRKISEPEKLIIPVNVPRKPIYHSVFMSSDNISISPRSARKPIAKVEPSLVTQCQPTVDADVPGKPSLDKAYSSDSSGINEKTTTRSNERLKAAEVKHFSEVANSMKASQDSSVDETTSVGEMIDINSTRSSTISSLGSDSSSNKTERPTTLRPQNLETLPLSEKSQITSENDSVTVTPLKPKVIALSTETLEFERTPVPAKEVSVPQQDDVITEADKIRMAKAAEERAPTTPTNQHFFPRTHQQPQLPIGDVSGAKSEEGLEKAQTDASHLVNNGEAEASDKTNASSKTKSTKITRSSHVTKRPQTVSVSRLYGKSRLIAHYYSFS